MPTYQALRNSHFRITLKSWFRGLDKAVIAIVVVLQFILTAIVVMVVYGLAQALSMLQAETTGRWDRILVVAAWQGISFILLRALREAALMPRARAFFDALPVPATQKFQADSRLALLGYSFLWLPVGWCLYTASTPGRVLPVLAELVTISLCVNLTVLRGATRPATLALAALG